MDVVINLIQTMGFPIAACVFLGYYIKTQNAQYREDVKTLTEKYEAAIEKFSNSIDKNTEVLNRLEVKLNIKEIDIEA